MHVAVTLCFCVIVSVSVHNSVMSCLCVMYMSCLSCHVPPCVLSPFAFTLYCTCFCSQGGMESSTWKMVNPSLQWWADTSPGLALLPCYWICPLVARSFVYWKARRFVYLGCMRLACWHICVMPCKYPPPCKFLYKKRNWESEEIA